MVPVKAKLPPDLAEALIELRKAIPDARLENPILPHRKSDGLFEYNVALPRDSYSVQWERFQRKHLLAHLRPVDLRHWVSTVCRRAGLSYPGTNAMQGHKCTSINMRDRYDCPEDEEIFAEQARILPYGPIGFVWPKIEIAQELPAELTEALSSCLKGEMLPTQLMEKVTAYLIRQIKKPATTMIA